MFSPLDNLIDRYKVNKDNTHPKFIERDGLQDIVIAISKELVNALPHGSGIDSDWGITHIGGLQFECTNSFHAMDNNGYYCGWIDFTVLMSLSTMDFDVKACKAAMRQIEAEYDMGSEVITDNAEDNYLDSDSPCPYFDDLEDGIYESIKFALEHYTIRHTIRYAVQSYPDLVRYEMSKAII